MPPGKRMCSQGSNCAGFGTMDGCFDWHRPEDVQVMREKRGSEFVSGQTRKLVYAMLAEKAAAPVPPTTQQPTAPQPVPAAAVTPETRAQQAAAHLARVKHAQNEFSGCALPVPIIPTTLGVSRTVLEHKRIAHNQHIATPVKLIAKDFVPYQMISGRLSRSSHLCRRPRSLLLPWRCDTRRRHRPVVMVRLQHRDACSHRQRRLRPRPRPIDVPSVLMSRASLPSQG